MRNVEVRKLVVLTFLAITSLGYAAEPPRPGHATVQPAPPPAPVDSGTVVPARPSTTGGASEEKYSQIFSFADSKKDVKLQALIEGDFTLNGSLLSTKFKKWITEIKGAHARIWKECKEGGGEQLNSLLDSYAEAIAQEIDEATRNPGKLIQDGDSQDKAPVRVERFFSFTSAVRAILDKQLTDAPEDKKARIKLQNKALLANMDKVNGMFAGIGVDSAKASQAEREKALEKIKAWPLSEVGHDGLKLAPGTTVVETTTETTTESLQVTVDQVETGKVCWFDDKGRKPLAPGESEIITETVTETESGQVTVHTDDKPPVKPEAPPAPQPHVAPQPEYTPPAAGYNGNLPYDALLKGVEKEYGSAKINYPTSNYTPPVIAGGAYKAPPQVAAAPVAAVPAAAAPIAAVAPLGGGFGLGFGFNQNRFGGYPQQMYPPMMPAFPVPPPIYKETETVTETATPIASTPAKPIPKPMQEPPPPPQMVNSVNVIIRVRKADGTIETLPPGSPIPAGATVITDPNPAAGIPISTTGTATTTTPNVNTITGAVQGVNTTVR